MPVVPGPPPLIPQNVFPKGVFFMKQFLEMFPRATTTWRYVKSCAPPWGEHASENAAMSRRVEREAAERQKKHFLWHSLLAQRL